MTGRVNEEIVVESDDSIAIAGRTRAALGPDWLWTALFSAFALRFSNIYIRKILVFARVSTRERHLPSPAPAYNYISAFITQPTHVGYYRSPHSLIEPALRFDQESFYHPQSDRLSTMPMKGGYFLREDPGAFDPSFFNFSAEVAAGIDPQIRIQLEVVFEALESAGLTLSSVAGSNTSVFTASFTKDYHGLHLRDPMKMSPAFITGNYGAMLANRVSHFFDLKGPFIAIDTGCSTSLMGLHLVAYSLRSRESDCAIVGGACLNLSPDTFVNLSTIQTCGPDGKCFAFDARAQGYGRGDGVSAVIVKRLSSAIRDGDVVRAIVRETASNQDGRTPTTTTPSSDAQRTLIKACYARAGLDSRDTTVFEAHGTGTRVGDLLIEILSLHHPVDWSHPTLLKSVEQVEKVVTNLINIWK
ncbi:hypothetical protein SUNI508_08955 [Seiridium unicorne]|uniref:Ketosynthase family 3 (KS3) domain-containing protein n=1 Tax=Seiridium unicorne TaxID=138068 RepID=A0ABR2USN6_9PEZI